MTDVIKENKKHRRERFCNLEDIEGAETNGYVMSVSKSARRFCSLLSLTDRLATFHIIN
jgi:hypothetical protein